MNGVTDNLLYFDFYFNNSIINTHTNVCLTKLTVLHINGQNCHSFSVPVRPPVCTCYIGGVVHVCILDGIFSFRFGNTSCKVCIVRHVLMG